MSNETMKEAYFFTRQQIDERDLLRVFERELGLTCDSMLHPKESSVAFLMTLTHDDGFRYSVALYWREGPVFDKSLAQLVQIFADEFGTEILFESELSVIGASAEEWQLAVPDGGVPTVVSIIDLADGIDVAGDYCLIAVDDPLMPPGN